jgi:hypothetical protein
MHVGVRKDLEGPVDGLYEGRLSAGKRPEWPLGAFYED